MYTHTYIYIVRCKQVNENTSNYPLKYVSSSLIHQFGTLGCQTESVRCLFFCADQFKELQLRLKTPVV